MRKYIMLIMLLLLTGCVSISNVTDYKIIMNDIVSTDSKLYNKTSKGYKYYLPKGLNLVSNDDFNQKIIVNDTVMYVYVDIVSYYYKSNDNYDDNCSECWYYAYLNNEEKNGYIKINKQDDNKYLMEIMYNYAKVEVITNYDDLAMMTSYASSILASIDYNDVVINDIMNKNYFSSIEKSYELEKPDDTVVNVLDVLEEYNQYVSDDDFTLPDEKNINNEK